MSKEMNMSNLISRQDAINLVEDMFDRRRDYTKMLVNQFKALPSADRPSCSEKPNNSDLIRRRDAIRILACEMRAEAMSEGCGDYLVEDYIPEATEWMNDAPSVKPKTGEWIPIKWHEITDEEREREGYPKDWVVHIDCDMPNDGDEILVQTKNGYIRWDVCYEDGEFSLDSGWDWIEDIVAWMPLPEPYRKGGEEE